MKGVPQGIKSDSMWQYKRIYKQRKIKFANLEPNQENG
jgi:hypothetical protein